MVRQRGSFLQPRRVLRLFHAQVLECQGQASGLLRARKSGGRQCAQGLEGADGLSRYVRECVGWDAKKDVPSQPPTTRLLVYLLC